MRTEISGRRFLDSFFIREPQLTFGDGQRHVDPKAGLAIFGPCLSLDPNVSIPYSIRVGVVGTGTTVGLAEKWLEKCKEGVPASSKNPRLHPVFPGFTSVFGCDIVHPKQWKEIISDSDVKSTIKVEDFGARVRKGVRIFTDHLKNLVEREPRPQVAICALPQEIVDFCGTKGKRLGRVRLTSKERWLRKIGEYHRRIGQQTLLPLGGMEPGLTDFLPQMSDFRRILKAEAMQIGVPTQIAWPSTFTGDSAERRTLQDEATRAWNFSLAMYYKGGGFPWRMADAQYGTCYVGISFYREYIKESRMRTSLAQIFTHTGEGLVLRGDRFEWDETRGRSPHLSKEGAHKLLSAALELYRRHMTQAPARLVVHKSSRYWADELEGFKRAAVGIERVDFLAIEQRGIRFLRKGKYPPIRGTVIELAPSNYLIYTRGYVPYHGTYPGQRIPNPIEVLEHHGDSDPRTICAETLALTKMNWNNTDYSAREPITLAFSREVGRILAYLPEGVAPKTQYLFYM